jgi:hypothetical protein
MIRRWLSAIALLHPRAAHAAEGQPTPQPLEPLVWPLVGGEQPGIRTFAGHANTVLDIVGRIGTPPSLVIFTEGNHLMVLLSDDIVGAFPAWAKAQPQYADLHLDNVVVVTLPQPLCIQMGYVANFAQEVVKGQVPLSVEGIRQPGSRTIRPQCGPRLPLRPPSAVS